MFEELKALLQNVPVLKAPDLGCVLNVAAEAINVAAGAVLLQEDDEGVQHPVCYFFQVQQKSKELLHH